MAVDISVPQCDYRRDMVECDNGRVRYQCSHPRLRGPLPLALVMPVTCRECEFCRWGMATAIESYSPRHKWSPTWDQYKSRVEICHLCEHRQENYCLKAGGACGLQFSLTKSSFACPIGNFGTADNEGIDAREQQPQTQSNYSEYRNGAHAAADAPADDAAAGPETESPSPGSSASEGDGDGENGSRIEGSAE